MKLYISDLDGTLLNSDKELSEYTKETLNVLIAKGVSFSIATARTAASVVKIISGLNISVPAVLMNGAAIYDMQKGEYIKTEEIHENTTNAIIDIFKAYDTTGFMYAIDDNKLITYYESLNTPALKNLYEERTSKYNKAYEQTDSFLRKTKDGKIVYFTLVDEKETLLCIFEDLEKLADIDMVMYKDVYNEDLWFLELFSKKASKRNAVNYLREYCGFDSVIGFGDNYNDLSFFEACDEGYAVENAVEELKKNAAGIIKANNSDGVARFIAQREGL